MSQSTGLVGIVERIHGKAGPMGAGSTAEPGRWDAAGRRPRAGTAGEGVLGGEGLEELRGERRTARSACSSGGSQRARALVGAVMTFYF